MDKMWYVVHILKPKKTCVVPGKWVKKISDQMENFINNSLNKTFKFLVYYSKEPECRMDGRPIPEYEPKFYMDIDGDFPTEGCYFGRKKCTVS